jgi:hypothetical protein
MSFLIRVISQSASGREIIRPRRVTGDSVLIGRDPSNAIHLSDLAVRPQHARIARSGTNQLLIEALTELPVTVNDKTTRKRQITIAKGAEVRIGSHRIEIRAGDDPDDILLDVSAIEATSIDREAATRRFGLTQVAPGKRTMAYTLIGLILGAFLLWPILSFQQTAHAKLTAEQLAHGSTSGVHADASWSTGALSAAHAPLEKNCKACHVDAFVAVQDKTCTTCHTKVHDHANSERLLAAVGAPTGLQGVKASIARTFGRDPGRCVDCHAEHQGKQTVAHTDQRFCSDCHADMKSHLPDTKLADAGDFGTSHPELRPLVMTKSGFERMPMDSAPQETRALKFPHDMHLSRANGVARMAQTLGKRLDCASCHVPDDSGTRFQPVSMERDCQQCHALGFDRVGGTVRTLRHGDVRQVIADIRAHAASTRPASGFVEGMRRRPGAASLGAYQPVGVNGAQAVRAVFSRGGACFDCHQVTPPKTAGGLDYGIVPVRQQQRYLMHGWFDHGAHKTAKCATCHAAAGSRAASDLLLPKLETCQSCHSGEKARPPAIASTCVMCHGFHPADGAPSARRTAGVAGAPLASVPLKLRWAH